jgi:hypothetical protein
MHRTKPLTIFLTLALGAAALSAPATAAAAPTAQASAFVTHRGHFWSWAGPRNWHAGYGKQGITILGDNDEVLDLGFSSILCTAAPSVAASVRRYFKGQRRAIARGRTNILRKTRIRRVRGLGINYFRQSLDIATRAHGRRLLGQIALDYQVPDPTYCYRRSLALIAPARGFGASLRTLLRVYGSLAYFGPGAPELPDD